MCDEIISFSIFYYIARYILANVEIWYHKVGFTVRMTTFTGVRGVSKFVKHTTLLGYWLYSMVRVKYLIKVRSFLKFWLIFEVLKKATTMTHDQLTSNIVLSTTYMYVLPLCRVSVLLSSSHSLQRKFRLTYTIENSRSFRRLFARYMYFLVHRWFRVKRRLGFSLAVIHQGRPYWLMMAGVRTVVSAFWFKVVLNTTWLFLLVKSVQKKKWFDT